MRPTSLVGAADESARLKAISLQRLSLCGVVCLAARRGKARQVWGKPDDVIGCSVLILRLVSYRHTVDLNTLQPLSLPSPSCSLSRRPLSLSLSPSLSLSDSNSSLPPPLCLTGFPPSPLSFNSQQRVSHRQCARRRSCPPQHAPPPFVPPDYSPLWTPACLRQGKRRSQRRPPPAEEKRRREGFISSPGAVLEAIASWRPFFAFSFSHRRRLHCTAALTLPVRSPFSRLSSSVQCLR